MSDEAEERALRAAHHAARHETAPEDLADRVIAQLEYRNRLEAPLLNERRVWGWPGFLLGVAAGAGVAAAAWLFVPPPQATPPIAAERPAGSAAAGPAARHVTAPDPCRERTTGSGRQPLIDDFEDGDDAPARFDERAGFWRWARETDAPGTAPALLPVPRVDATPRNRLALHAKGGLLNDWGATVEVDFRPRCYDATRYAGIAFQARGPGRVFLSPRQVDVIPVSEGGTCEHDCHNGHLAKIDLSPEWRSYEVRWADFRQRGIDKPALDPSRLHSIAFLIHPEDTPYDLWFDDVRFLPSPS